MSTSVDQQYDEEIELIASAGMVTGGDEQRTDLPQQAQELDGILNAAAQKQNELNHLTSWARRLRAELLPDDERQRLAQLVRDIRDDNLPDVDEGVPVTPCPTWCESDRCENGQGKYHEGAITTVQGVNWKTGMKVDYRSADLYVSIDSETCRPVLNIDADVDLDCTGAMDLSVGLVKAALLFKELGGAAS